MRRRSDERYNLAIGQVSDNQSVNAGENAGAGQRGGFWRRYVVLLHEGFGQAHYDIMLELEPGAKLATWQSPAWPITARTVTRRLPDHRREYLEYEGPVSGGRGRVRRISGGSCAVRQRGDDEILVRFEGDAVMLLTHEGGGQWAWIPAANITLDGP